jgi:GntR family transcriptional regulator
MTTIWNRPLQESSPIPLWFQVAERLRQAIADGVFTTGEALPSEAQLNETFGISRATSRMALDSLKQEGLIFRKSGKGSIVLSPRVEQPANEMFGFSVDMRRRGLRPSYETRFAGRVRASAEVAEALEIGVKASVYQSRRLLNADDQPIGFALSWLSPALFKRVSPPSAEELSSGSLYAWLKENCGVMVAGARESIEAAIVVDDMAHELQVPAGSAVLVIRRRSDAADGSPIEYAILYFRSDRYRLHLSSSSVV